MSPHRFPQQTLAYLGACLALAGAAAAAAAAAFSIFPATAIRVDRPVPGQASVRSIGLDHGGGDMKRAPRLTRRSRRRQHGQLQAWTDSGMIVLPPLPGVSYRPVN
jgi:hypothetical protein